MVRFCKSSKCLVGKTAIITGANAGIGYETALELAKRGCRVIMACRNPEKATKAQNKIYTATKNETVIFKQINLDSLSSVRKFAQEINETEDRLDLLINNAGAIYSPEQITEDGLQLEMATNYFSHFLLTVLLLDLLQKSAPSRVINVSSTAATLIRNFKLDKLNKRSGGMKLYSKGKLCQILFTQELAKRMEGTGVTAYSLHPGAIHTEMFTTNRAYHIVASRVLKSPLQGAQTSIYLAVEDGVENHSGQHFENCKRVKPYRGARNEEKAKKLWEITEVMVGLREK